MKEKWWWRLVGYWEVYIREWSEMMKMGEVMHATWHLYKHVKMERVFIFFLTVAHRHVTVALSSFRVGNKTRQKVKYETEERRVPLTLEIGELDDFRMEFECCHHLIVPAYVVESLELVIGEFLGSH
ncbi:hypothetical protein VNO80_22524 [Phaseolus coccineus]|uniref:Uncharacterized protein n=1 Tax=Phaseolus coccineus TaxID=3886 RepID=A0AAN9M847_PHACN